MNLKALCAVVCFSIGLIVYNHEVRAEWPTVCKEDSIYKDHKWCYVDTPTRNIIGGTIWTLCEKETLYSFPCNQHLNAGLDTEKPCMKNTERKD